MYERILVTIDFSEPSARALRWTARRYPEAELVLFHAVEAAETPEYLLRALGEEVDFDRVQQLDVESNLRHLAEELPERPDAPPTRIVIRPGWPPRQVNVTATEEEADLVVVGAHTKRIWPWDEPGATAETIVQHSDRSVLVWRPAQHRGDQAILAPLDLREGSDPVAAMAAEHAAYFDARLVLLHVLPGLYQAHLRAVSSPARVEESLRKIEASAREEAQRRVPERLRERVETQVIVVRGRPITQILTVAEMESADMIVMGRSYPPNLPGPGSLGRVTSKVIRGASCAVLSVPL